MPIAEQLTEPLMDTFTYGVETTTSGSTYIKAAGDGDTPNKLYSDLYYTQWWQDPVQWDKFYDPRYLTFFAFRVKAREVYPHSSDSGKGGPISVDVCLLNGSPILSNAYIYKKVTAPADYNNWVYFPADDANFRTEWVILSHSKSGALRAKSGCFDGNGNPIRGTSYISVDEVQAEYRQWIIDDTFMTAELALLTPISDYEPPIPYSQWRKQDGEIKLGFGVEELPDFEEVLPLSLWRYDTTQLVCPYCTEMRGTPVIHKVFHRLLPGHVAPEPPPPEPDLPFEDIPTLEYDVYCDGKPLHVGTSPLESYRLMDGVLTLQDSAAGSFEFTIPSFHALYNTVEMMASTITVVLNGEEIWEGRPVSFKENLWKEHAVTCEGALAYLNDIYLPPMAWTNTTPDVILRNIIDGSDGSLSTNTYCYNVKCAENRKIYVGAVPTPDASKYTVDVEKYVCGYDTVLNVVFDICKKWGYHIYMEKVIDETTGNKIRKIQFKGDEGYGENVSQKIVFGRNLVDYSKSYNFATIVTALLPLGAKLSTNKKVEIDEISSPWTPNRSAGYKVVERYTYVENNVKYQITREAVTESSNNYILYELDLYNKNYNYVYVTTKVSAPWVDRNNNKHEPAFFAIRTGESGSYVYYEAKYGKGAAGEGTIMSKHKIDVTQFQNEPTAVLLISYYNDGTLLSGMVINRCKTSDEAQEEYVTIADIVDGTYDQTTGEYSGYTEPDSLYAISPRVDEAGKTPIQRYGRIEKKIEWSDVKDSTTLYNNAVSYLNSDQFDGLQIEMTAMDMKMFNVNVNRLKVGEYVHCVAPPYGLDKLMPIRALKIPILKPEDAKYTVGDSRQSTLTSTQNASNDELARLIGEKPTIGSVLVAAKQTAYETLTNYNNSYVTIRYGANGGAEAIIISDAEDYTQSQTGYWIWNANGLGFVSPGTPEDQAPIAITPNGMIEANFIATGTMYADRIRGGALRLGDISEIIQGVAKRVGGIFEVYGSEGSTVISDYPMIRIGRETGTVGVYDYSQGMEFIEPKTGINNNEPATWGHYVNISGGRIYFAGHGSDGHPPAGPYAQIANTHVDGYGYFQTLSISSPRAISIEAPTLLIGSSLSPTLTVNSLNCGGTLLWFKQGLLVDYNTSGGANPISDGNHTIHDGDVITTQNGIITAITTPSNNNNS